MKKPEIGGLRHRVIIQNFTTASDSQGGTAQTWADLATVWALLEPVKAFEKMFGSRLQYVRTHTCIIRHRTGVDTTMRISFDSRTFQVKGIRDPDEKNFFLILDLEENVAT